MKEFTTQQIEDVLIMFKINGKHYAFVGKPGVEDVAKQLRVSLVPTLLNDTHGIIETALEDR